LWCKYAGVYFWKVDWGAHCNAGLEGIVPYRKMMSDVAKKCFPELIIEHSTCTAPVNGVFGDESKFRYADMDGFKDRGRELCEFSDVFRTYDVTDDMLCDTTTLDRVSYFLPFSKCVVNCEDTLYIGAALGCSVGIMRSSYGKNWMKVNSKLDEVTATVKWQRFAPSFVGGEFNMSDDILVDSMYFGPYDSWAKEAKNRVVDQAAAAVMARNTELPTVVREDKMPFVIIFAYVTLLLFLGFNKIAKSKYCAVIVNFYNCSIGDLHLELKFSVRIYIGFIDICFKLVKISILVTIVFFGQFKMIAVIESSVIRIIFKRSSHCFDFFDISVCL
jgi:hypothetical protein